VDERPGGNFASRGKKGYNTFALIYRPGARTIAFLHENAAKLGINMRDYSLWGGSAMRESEYSRGFPTDLALGKEPSQKLGS